MTGREADGSEIGDRFSTGPPHTQSPSGAHTTTYLGDTAVLSPSIKRTLTFMLCLS
jgi:hypothetical protein